MAVCPGPVDSGTWKVKYSNNPKAVTLAVGRDRRRFLASSNFHQSTLPVAQRALLLPPCFPDPSPQTTNFTPLFAMACRLYVGISLHPDPAPRSIGSL
jgi:hypothetical protein